MNHRQPTGSLRALLTSKSHASVVTPSSLSRRAVLKSLASGFGYLAFAGLAQQTSRGGDQPGNGTTHFPARAKRVIFLCMNGGPSHVDTFDYKPKLNAGSGETTAIGQERGGIKLLGSPFRFARHGESGVWMSEVFPHLAKQADELCFLHSMHTDLPNHSQAFGQLHTGSFQFVRPSLGAWTLYGLGSENGNLPGFITINPPADNGGAKNYGSAFLPAVCQGTRIGTNQIPEFYAKLLGKDQEPGPPMKFLESALPGDQQRAQLELIQGLNRHKLRQEGYQPEIEGAIESFELAFRMQGEIPDLLNLQGETAATLRQYGIGSGLPTDRFGRQCLLARRMTEAGVRFVEITSPEGWDHHRLLQTVLPKAAQATDQPIAALLADLKQRGLLEDTLVIWAGEFGRTPYAQSFDGRDHNHKGFTIWMAGGGVKGGFVHGATDEYGYQAEKDPVHIHDWHATILHLLGLDHKRLTFNYASRDFRLTDIHGEVVRDILV